MALYDETVPWEFNRYSIRRKITLLPDSLIPGQESLCAVPIPTQDTLSEQGTFLVSKGSNIMPSYWIYSGAGLPEYVVFKTDESITSINNDYYLYYGTAYRYITFESDPYFLSSETDLLVDHPFSTKSKWSFVKPTVDWRGTTAISVGARATFVFYGHKAILTLGVGPDHGQVKIILNSSESNSVNYYSETNSILNGINIVDCYAAVNGTMSVDIIEALYLDEWRISLEALGSRSPQSSGSAIEIIKMEYHQILEGTLGAEEILSDAAANYNSGQ